MGRGRVSIDGDRAARDLQPRAVRGSYDSALAAVDHLRDAGGCASGFNTQINRVSAPHLEAVFELLLAKDGEGWQLQLTVPMGRAARPEWLLQPYELMGLLPRLAALAERATARAWCFNPPTCWGTWAGTRWSCAQGDPERSRGCPAGHQGLGIEADGGVKGCPSLPSEAYRAGADPGEAPLRSLVERAPALRFTRDDRSRRRWGCASGPCAGRLLVDGPRALGRRRRRPLCHHRALELQREGLRERVELRERAPGLPLTAGTSRSS